MSEEAAPSGDIKITIKGPSELKLSIDIDPSKLVSDLKEVIAEQSGVEKERQRLIYSGKVLKDEEQISFYKIKNGHTVHMVKGADKKATAPSTSGGGSTSSPSTAQRLPQMGTGLNPAGSVTDSLEQHMPPGIGGFNTIAGMMPPGMEFSNDPNAMANMMQSPEFMRSMADMMSRPEVVDQMIEAHPQFRAMAPQIRQTMQSPMFRAILSDPNALRAMMQMQGQMRQGGGAPNPFGMGGFPGGAGTGSPPATGAGGTTADPFPNLFAAQPAPATGNTTATGANPTTATGTVGTSPSTGAPGAAPGAPDFGAIMRAMQNAAPAQEEGGAPATNPQDPFGFQNMFGGGMGGMGGLGGGMGGLGGMGGWGLPPAAPADNRPPEEIYATQLGQLNGMGLWDAQKNIRALRATGGNVEAAIELIFSGSLDQPGQQ